MSENPNQRPDPYRLSDDTILELVRGATDYGKILLRSAILINGGAAIALLAFIGSVRPTGLEASAISSLKLSLFLFFLGLAFALLCGISNLYAHNSVISMHHGAVRSGKQYYEVKSVLLKFIRIDSLVLTVYLERLSYALYVLSFILFASGVYISIHTLFDVLSVQSNAC